MKINIITIGTQMPSWVTEGVNEYLIRMPMDYQVMVTEIPAVKRLKNADFNAILEKEGIALLAKTDHSQINIALDRIGKEIDTKMLSQHLQQWHDEQQNINLLIGGPEGIHQNTLKQAHLTWSLSRLTLPHPLVRILIAEQLYRAYTIIKNHPYHR